MSIFCGFRGSLRKRRVLFFENIMGVFKVKKDFGRKMWTTFCGSPLIEMNPPSRPSLRTHLNDTCSWLHYNKTKIISYTRSRALQPELLWICLTVTGAKVYLVSDCSVKNPYLTGWHIPYSPYMGVPPPPRSCYKEWSAHIIGRLLSLAEKKNCTTPIS